MAKRNRPPVGAFGDSSPQVSMQEVDEAFFGKIRDAEATKQVAKPVDIFKIYPDYSQPRRALPSALRTRWNGETESLVDVFGAWIDLVHEERGDDAFDVVAYLHAEDEVESRSEQPGALESALLEVVNLAVSFRREGLTNPITIARIDGTRFRLETGERRWLAYHLLHATFPDGDPDADGKERYWNKIPARIVEAFSPWRQATENSARADLNAIAKARQFAILLMDLYRREGVEFRSYDEFMTAGESDRAYYAQVADGQEFGIPYGKGNLLRTAMGVTSKSVFDRCRKILTLPDEVWFLGDDYNFPEATLSKLAGKEPEDAIALARQMVLSQNHSEDEIVTPVDTAFEYTPGTSRHFDQLKRLIKRADKGKEDAVEPAMEMITELRRLFDEFEQRHRKNDK